MAENFTLSNIVFGIGIAILIGANLLFYISIKGGIWGGLVIFAVYLGILGLAGFPLVPILFVILVPAGFLNTKPGKAGDLFFISGLLSMNILYIVQWLIWRHYLQS